MDVRGFLCMSFVYGLRERNDWMCLHARLGTYLLAHVISFSLTGCALACMFTDHLAHTASSKATRLFSTK